MSAALVNGARANALALDDRGLAYGDGVFETMLAARGAIALWPRHYARLARGCAALRIARPDRGLLEREIADLLASGGSRAVVKLIVSAGGGARGYARAGGPATRILTLHDAPASDPHALTVRWCETRCAIQPRLAGVKHLNRLEQVLARAEWSDPAIDEGLMLDTAGRVVGAIAGNVFARVGARWVTPALDHCGVAGVLRELILDQQPFGVGVQDILPTMIDEADELFLTNAVRGIRPVRALGAREYAVGEQTRALMARFASLGFGGAP